MNTIKLRIPQSMDSVGRVISIVRRAKVSVKRLELVSTDSLYEVEMYVEGAADEVQWLVAKLDKLPEVLEIKTAPIITATAIVSR